MKRSLVAFGIVFLLMLNIASASVLTYYGKIIGTADVEGPTFYASNEEIPHTLYYKKLLINQPPTAEGDVSLIDGQSQSFGSDGLNVESFYQPKFNFYVEAKVDTDEPKPLILTVYTWDTSTTATKEFVCQAILDVSSLANYTTTCSGSSSLSLSPSYGFLWEIKGGVGLANITYTIYLKGNTKIEVDKA